MATKAHAEIIRRAEALGLQHSACKPARETVYWFFARVHWAGDPNREPREESYAWTGTHEAGAFLTGIELGRKLA